MAPRSRRNAILGRSLALLIFTLTLPTTTDAAPATGQRVNPSEIRAAALSGIEAATTVGHPILEKLSFITGRWRGELKGSVIEECWSAPEGDNMMGMFRLVKEDEGVFYEFMTIEQAGDTPVLRIRHFGQGLDAWEEKDHLDPYPLVELGAARAVFENQESRTRLIYDRNPADRLTITLEKTKDGKNTSQVFVFRRAD